MSQYAPPPDDHDTRKVLKELDRLVRESEQLRADIEQALLRERRSHFPERRRRDTGHTPERRQSN